MPGRIAARSYDAVDTIQTWHISMKDSGREFFLPTPQKGSVVGVSSEKSGSAKQVSTLTRGGDISVSFPPQAWFMDSSCLRTVEKRKAPFGRVEVIQSISTVVALLICFVN